MALEKLKLTRDDEDQRTTPSDEIGVMEAVITQDSELVGSSRGQMKLLEPLRRESARREMARRAHRASAARGEAQPGDVIVLQGDLTTMPETLGELHCLPLAERDLRIGSEARLTADRRCWPPPWRLSPSTSCR